VLRTKCLILLAYMGKKESAPGVTRTPDLLIRSRLDSRVNWLINVWLLAFDSRLVPLLSH